MFVAQKGKIDFDQACEHAQVLEKNIKRCSHDLSSSLFSNNNDDKYNDEEDNESEISRLKEQVKILHKEILSLHNQNNKLIMHNEEKVASIYTTLIGSQENQNLGVNSLHFD